MRQTSCFRSVVHCLIYNSLSTPIAIPNSLAVEVTFDYIPTLFAGLLNAHGQLGPAEIKPKHKFVFKDAIRKAKKDHNLDLKFPPAHPFMPLPSLRLATALRQDQHPLYSTVVENIYH
ncbi:hypothetical protein SARC_14104, partial [Sphaeroforma arctica JP610]